MMTPASFSNRLLTAAVLACLAVPIAGCGRDTDSSDAATNVDGRANGGAAGSESADAKPGAAPLTNVSFSVPDQPPHGYVGSMACRDCHADVHAAYQTHPMASSMAIATDSAGEDLEQPAEFSPFEGVTYQVSSADGRMRHTEQRSSGDQVLYEHSVPIDFRVGSGVHGFSYLLQSGGLMFQSPVSWYRQEACWDMSPGYDLPTHPGFERLVTHNCIACHAGTARPLPGSQLRFEADAFAELQVGCERCHGPGQAHIAFHNSDELTGRDPILKFAELSAETKNAVCFQCHLQGAQRIPRYGRSEFDFRPGMKMSDVWTTFLKDPQTTEGSAVSHAEQMFQSRCYTQSGQLTCVSCHDPHRRPQPAEAVDWYRGRCLECHSGPDDGCAQPREDRIRTQPDDSCIACHMPPASLEAVPHTAHTDHRVLRQPDAAPQAVLTELLEENESGNTPSDLQRARGIRLAELAYGTEDRIKAAEALRLLAPVLEQIPADSLTCEAAGRAASTLGLPDQAIAFWDQALQERPQDVLLLLLKGSEQHNARQFAAAADTYRRLIAADSHRAMYHGRLSHVLGMMGQVDESIAASQAALKRNPGLPQAHSWLAMLYQRRGAAGDDEKSAWHREQAQLLQDSFRASMEGMSADTPSP